MARKRRKSRPNRAEIIAQATAPSDLKDGEARPLGFVPLYAGKHVGELVAEADPDGRVTVHAYRRDGTVYDRLLHRGTITKKLHQAAEQFRGDFERAKLTGHFGTPDLLRESRGGRAEMSDAIVAARQRCHQALQAVGYGHRHAGLMARAIWWLCGECETLDQFAWRVRAQAQTMNADKASGLLIAGLEALALYYDIADHAEVRAAANVRAEIRAQEAAAIRLRDMATLERTPDGRKALQRAAAAFTDTAERLRTVNRGKAIKAAKLNPPQPDRPKPKAVAKARPALARA